MSTFSILMEQIGLFVIYILVGIVMVLSKVLNRDSLEIISRFVMKLALPVMIFANTINGVDRNTLFQSASILGFTILMYIFIFSLGKGLTVLFRVKGDQGHVYHALAMFGNIGFIGIPIITSIYPENGMLYISVFTIIDQLILWTVGVKLTSPSGKGRFNPKKLINLSTVAIVLAVVVVLTGIRPPALLNTALQKIGATATPIAMIYLGGVFACMDIRKYIRYKEFYGIAVVKMLLLPLVFYQVLGLFPITDEIHLTMTLLTALPSMSTIVMMAKSAGSDGDYAMGGIFVTTVCSILTLPAVCWILQ